MRLRRLELAVLAITLAFAFFMGGFFTGRSLRSHSAVSVTATAAGQENQGAQISASQQTPPGAAQTPQSTETATEAPTTGSANGGSADDQGTSQGTGAPKAGDGRININTATHGELTDLPGVGNAIAQRIIDHRQKNGNFARIEDIMNVSGIGERRFEAMKDMITVGDN